MLSGAIPGMELNVQRLQVVVIHLAPNYWSSVYITQVLDDFRGLILKC